MNTPLNRNFARSPNGIRTRVATLRERVHSSVDVRQPPGTPPSMHHSVHRRARASTAFIWIDGHFDGQVDPSEAGLVVTLTPFGDRWEPVKVRELIREVEQAGWRQARQKGSHRQFSHSERPGVITVSGNLGKDVPLGLLRAILKQAGTPKEPK